MLLSVIIPSYNSSHYLPGAVESVLDGFEDRIEIIVVDDGSTDDIESVLAALGERYFQLRWVRQSNQGVAAARNNGAKVSTGDILLFLDADDIICPGGLAAAVDAIETDEVAHDFYIGRYSIACEDGSLKWMPATLGNNQGVRNYLSGRLSVQQGAYLIRREAYLEAPFPEGLVTQEDIPFFLSCLARLDCLVVDVEMVRYHKYRGSVSKAKDKALQEGFANMDVLFESPYCCPVLESFRNEIYRAKARGLVRYALKNGSVEDLLRVYRGYIDRVGFRAFLDIRYQFKFLKALLRLWSK
ncbi:MAG: hypothetical protein CL537_12130 [Alcanivoracaceae bacterium]|mgnify:CR=1 FL=1|nr:hypothetical protein [Alcanivoracaceae bacterium]MCG8438999.1 glycosyltransferase [Pseudomonadales bacterium]|tara:strand:+ start:3947 stop:4843 length:897 start_codon:yes stop_codon:yes gene_type:complete